MRQTGHLTHPRHRRPRRQGRNGRRGEARYYLRDYLIAVMTLAALALLVFPLAIIGYPLMGIWLSRRIGRQVAWSPNHATIASVSAAKLGTILRWPIAVPTFIWQVFVVRHL